jgi:hypothetical protein
VSDVTCLSDSYYSTYCYNMDELNRASEGNGATGKAQYSHQRVHRSLNLFGG